MLNLTIAIALTIASYVCIYFYGTLGSNAQSLKQALLTIFTWQGLALVIIANILFGAAMFLYAKQTTLGVAIAQSLGVITTFSLSVLIAQTELTMERLTGIGLILLGVLLLAR